MIILAQVRASSPSLLGLGDQTRAATLCSYTHAELVDSFAEYLDGVDLAEVRR